MVEWLEMGVTWEGISSVRGGGGARPNRVGLRLLSKFVISFNQINKVFLFLPHIWSNSCTYGTVLFINPSYRSVIVPVQLVLIKLLLILIRNINIYVWTLLNHSTRTAHE